MIPVPSLGPRLSARRKEGLTNGLKSGAHLRPVALGLTVSSACLSRRGDPRPYPRAISATETPDFAWSLPHSGVSELALPTHHSILGLQWRVGEMRGTSQGGRELFTSATARAAGQASPTTSSLCPLCSGGWADGGALASPSTRPLCQSTPGSTRDGINNCSVY